MPYDKTNKKMYVDCTTTPWNGIGTGDLAECFAVVLQKTVDGVVQRIVSLDVGANISAEEGDTIDGWTVVSRRPINKWARYKPECADGMLPLIHGDGTSGMRSRFANNFGLDVPYCPSYIMNAMVYDILRGAIEAWAYQLPHGHLPASQSRPTAIDEFRRISDFAQVPNDDTDPNYVHNPQTLKGYNHNAPVPFQAVLNMTGIKVRTDYLEVNLMDCVALSFEFGNTANSDLFLQDFINFNDNVGGKKWRTILQVFYNQYVDAREVKWYNKASADVEVIGGEIPISKTTNVQTSLPVTNLPNTGHSDDYYHLCIGIGCVNNDGSSWKGEDALFTIPEGFYYRFKVVSYFDTDKLVWTGLQWWYNSSYHSATLSNTTFTVENYADGMAFVAFTIKKGVTALHFTDKNNGAQQGYTRLRIRVKTNGNTYYLTPQKLNAYNRYTEDDAAFIPAGSSSETVTLYALIGERNDTPFNLNVLTNANPSVSFSTEGTVGDEPESTATWTNLSGFNIRKIYNS